MKVSLSSVVVVAGFCLAGIGFANAADAQKAVVPAGMHAPHHAARDPVAWAQKRLDNLSKKLNLTSAQQSAWSSYSSAILKRAQERGQEMEKRRSADRSKQMEVSTPDRLESMAARMRTGAERLSQLANDTKTFYAALSREQKTIFDLYAANAMRGRMSMMHRMHR